MLGLTAIRFIEGGLALWGLMDIIARVSGAVWPT